MRIWVFSDWHLEHRRVAERSVLERGWPDADVCVVPGDLHTGDQAVSFLVEEIAPRMPVIYVPGNHDYYGQVMDRMREAMRAEAGRHPDMHLLDPGAVVIDGVRFVGASLWTDYGLLGEDMRHKAMLEAHAGLNDHRAILAEQDDEGNGKLWTPALALERHRQERAFIEETLADRFDGPSVVVTHHGPHPESVHPRFRRPEHARLNPAFVSDLSNLIAAHAPPIWLHGHIHDSRDYVVGATRVVANPRGYQIRTGPAQGSTFVLDDAGRACDPMTMQPLPEPYEGPENRVFDPLLVVESR